MTPTKITSLTGALLHRTAFQLPTGRLQTQTPERQKRNCTPAQADEAARNAQTKANNIEHVYNTIADGVDTIPKLVPATGLSRSTVYFAIEALEDWPGGSRIERTKGPTHRFTVKTNEAPKN